MNYSLIARAALFNLGFDTLLVAFLVHNQFGLKETTFAGLLTASLFFWCLYAGTAAERHPEIHGFFVSLVSLALILLYLSIYDHMQWEVNAILAAVWVLVGFFGSKLGSALGARKKRRRA